MKSPSLKRTRILGTIALVVIAGLAWFFLLSSRIGEPAILEEAARASVEESASLKSQVALMQKQVESLPQAEQVADIISRRFPSTPDPATVIEQVQAAGARAGLVPSTIGITPGSPELSADSAPVPAPAPVDPAAVDPAADPAAVDPAATAAPPPVVATPLQTAKLPVTITASGSLEELTQFVVQLQTSDTIIVVGEVAFTAEAIPTETTTTVTNPDGTITTVPVDIPTEPQYTITINAYIPLLPPLQKVANMTSAGTGTDGTGTEISPTEPTTTIEPDLSNPPAPTSRPERGFN